MTDTIKELRAAYDAAQRVADAANLAAYRVTYSATSRVAATDADRVAVAAWDEYQAALKAAEKGGKP
jgi:hypothetical protein